MTAVNIFNNLKYMHVQNTVSKSVANSNDTNIQNSLFLMKISKIPLRKFKLFCSKAEY